FDRDFPGGRVVVSDRQELEQIPALVRQTTPNTPFVTADEAGLPRAQRKTDYSQIRPRVGFAYRLGNDNRSVVRGHFRIYTTPLLGGVNYSLAGVVTSYVPAYVNRALGNGRFALQYPNFFTGQAGAAAGNDFRRANQFDLHNPKTVQWVLGYERDL